MRLWAVQEQWCLGPLGRCCTCNCPNSRHTQVVCSAQDQTLLFSSASPNIYGIRQTWKSHTYAAWALAGPCRCTHAQGLGIGSLHQHPATLWYLCHVQGSKRLSTTNLMLCVWGQDEQLDKAHAFAAQLRKPRQAQRRGHLLLSELRSTLSALSLTSVGTDTCTRLHVSRYVVAGGTHMPPEPMTGKYHRLWKRSST